MDETTTTATATTSEVTMLQISSGMMVGVIGTMISFIVGLLGWILRGALQRQDEVEKRLADLEKRLAVMDALMKE